MVFKEKLVFPNTLAFGARGGRSWNTGVVGTAGGHFSTNQNWAAPLGRWQVSLQNRSIAEIMRIRSFVFAVRGRAFAFRFTAPFDFRANRVPARRITSTTFQMRQRFSATGETNYLDVKKPKPNDTTLRVSLGTTLTTDFVLDSTTGILTTGQSQPSNIVPYITGDYHVPVILGTDIPDFAFDDPGFGTWSSIELIEVPL